MWVLFFAIGGLIALASRSAGSGSALSWGGKADVTNLGYTTIVWSPLIVALAVPEGIPYKYGMAWVNAESEGNPCVIGERDSFGPDGNPREFGIAQVYNPDYYKFLGRGNGIKNGNSRRAYCRYPQTVTRMLTPEEMTEQVQDLVDVIKYCRDNADHMMALTNTSFPEPRDYWRFVKLYHALPSIVHALPQVVAKLGRAPTTWTEFRNTFCQVQPAAYHNPKVDRHHQSVYWRALQNAEDTGGVVPREGAVT